ncbi:MAG: M23 family metallopeptidase [Gammaproteobacteria bacterium]|nr:M23 family metallopeptidase [Gammaproteobacteria bacterium]MCY4277803.1 M23 family metallopeptidase [Gammaproteobacteria bacterium]
MERTVKAKLASLFLAPVYIVLVRESDGRRLSLRVTPVMLQIGLVLAVGALIACVMALNVIGTHYDGAIASASKFDAWETTIQEQRTELDTLRRESYLDIESVLTWAESLQEGLASIESLGTRMFEETGIEADDFDIQRSRIGGIGGPVLQGADGDDAPPVAPGELESTVASLEGMRATLEVRERQLSVLRALVLGASSERIEDKLSGKPVKSGWISSSYGRRNDPITHAPAFHNGMDFGARHGSAIIATGVGVVTFAGRDRSYGNYVEISHGDGLKTLYAHAGNIHVVPGDVVEKGQVIGEVGDTGRSTGPHVHYEVIHDGKRLNPWRFVHSS